MWHSDLPHLEIIEKLHELPRVFPRFFVPQLSDKPQNPILDTLTLTATNKALPPRPILPSLPPELLILAAGSDPDNDSRATSSLWAQAVARKIGQRNQLLSWDRLRPSHSSKASSTALLSEQDSLVFAFARYHVEPRVSDSNTDMVYVCQDDLLNSLKMTVLGTSSTMHIWDASSESFKQAGVDKGKRGYLLVDAKDEVISSSVISRFLTIGTLLRRLEVFLTHLRSRSAREGPTIHAFAHALSTVLIYLRNLLAKCPPNVPQQIEKLPLSAIWLQYAIYEEILVALSDLYGRMENLSPNEYLHLDSSPVPLLSRIYDHFDRHQERQSPQIIRAIFAFILTGASHEYLQGVARSVGSGGQLNKKSSHVVGERHDQYAIDDDDEDEETEEDLLDMLDKIEDTFPTFFPPELLDVLPAAQKSLVLLRNAQPDHPLLTAPTLENTVKWIWTAPEIEAVWSSTTVDPISQLTSPACTTTEPILSTYKPELAQFEVFDLEPGTFTAQPLLAVKDTSIKSLQLFINVFPESLPPITPTLSHLTSLVFGDLVKHASTLSSALLSLFLSPSSGNLNLPSHLTILRSYLLLTAPSFKSRLAAALFSDSEDHEVEKNKSIRALRRRSSRKAHERTQPWAVGLSPDLLERETWPPVGADLSFFLRTVIVDSFGREHDGDEREDDDEFKTDSIAEEAGWRLGFAIRDLPTDSGRDKWLNPLCIEALDFLYMDYKAPKPLEVLISPDIMSKYQRMFAFLLRLMRVESALKSLFRMTRSSSKPLFSTLTRSQKALLHFRFVAQSFIANLSSYVFDTAIGGNFNVFISRVSAEPSSSRFSDVFELAKSHSSLLDDILTACLLRSGQRAVGDVLRHALELVLEFVIVIGELHRGRLEEYQAAPLVDDLFKKFCLKMTTFTKVLKGLVDKGPSSLKWRMDSTSSGERHPPGGVDALAHLLMRLDLTDWWSKLK